MEFVAQRAELRYPVTPVMKCERYFVEELLSSNSGMDMQNEGAHSFLNIDQTTTEWNDRVEEERRKGKTVYPKAAGLLRAYLIKRAERRNRQQALSSTLGGTVVADRIAEVSDSLIESDRAHVFDPVQPEARRPHRDASQPDAGEVEAVPVPPVQVQASSWQAVQDLVQEQAHLARHVPTTRAAASWRRKLRRCHRCGKAKEGEHHSRRAKSNAVEYCTVLEEERTQFWRVPPGYVVGDTCAKEPKRDIARE